MTAIIIIVVAINIIIPSYGLLKTFFKRVGVAVTMAVRTVASHLLWNEQLLLLLFVCVPYESRTTAAEVSK